MVDNTYNTHQVAPDKGSSIPRVLENELTGPRYAKWPSLAAIRKL